MFFTSYKLCEFYIVSLLWVVDSPYYIFPLLYIPPTIYSPYYIFPLLYIPPTIYATYDSPYYICYI